MTNQVSTQSSKKYLVQKHDNVALALEDLKPGDSIVIGGTSRVTIKQPIEFGHKFAVKKIKKEERIIKHSEVIGKATRDISIGEHVHVHNVESLRAKRK